MKSYCIAACIAVFACTTASAQTTPATTAATPAAPVVDERTKGLSLRHALEDSSLVKNVMFRNVGPTVMSGRVTDIDVNPSDPTKFYVAYASGGLWYTDNNGQSFTPLFDHEDVITIGDIAVDWANQVIWVGTGEVNSSRSSYAGNGVYKSTDKGKTWIYCGLPESHHIGRVVVNPSNKDEVYVAVLGHLYTPNKERGVYKTVDGGLTWKQTLFIDENTGAIDLILDPNVSSFIYASTWHRERRAWNFTEAGGGSGIYKSIDNGETWMSLTDSTSGFPKGGLVGRIGLAVSYQHNNIVYAVVDNQFPKEDAKADSDPTALKIEDLKVITKENFALLEDAKIEKFLADNYFPKEYNAAIIKNKVASGEFKPSVLADYLNDGGYVFNLPIKGCEVYRSDNGGTTWYKTHTGYLDGAFFTYGYYFGTMKVSPQNENKLLLSAFNTLLSEDGGRTFKNIDGNNVHPDHHAAWFNPKNDKHIIIGNDGGINITYDNGANWYLANAPAVGQFYTVAVDDAKPYNVYGGLQDNGVWKGPSTYDGGNGWHATGQYPYSAIYGGDGMQVQVDTRDNTTTYTGYQYGFYARLNNATGNEEISIHPRHQVGEVPLRFNWQTPIWLSRHNQDILYYGSNKFHRSLNKAQTLETLSGDLTNGKKEGDVPYGTLTTIHESPMKFGLLYCGTDDGNVWVSKDAGYSWFRINVFVKKETAVVAAKGKAAPAIPANAIPDHLWVSRVTASKFNEPTVYVSLNGYRNDDFKPYLFVSNDYGTTWAQIGKNLPAEPINVVKEDHVNKNILYVGTDNGLYISFDKGNSFMAFNGGLPRVAVHDLVIQERENDIVIGTHGRSIYIADLEEIHLLDSVKTRDVYVYKPAVQEYSGGWGTRGAVFYDWNLPSASIAYYVNRGTKATVIITDKYGTTVKTFTDEAEAGLNYVNYDLSVDEGAIYEMNTQLSNAGIKHRVKAADNGTAYLVPGTYRIKVKNDAGVMDEKEFVVKED